MDDALYSPKSVSGLLLLALLIPGACHGREPYKTRDHRIALVTRGAAGFSEGVTAEMRRELDAILDPVSIDAQWRTVREAERTSFPGRLLVVRFKGSCRTRPFRNSEAIASTLGYAHVSEGAVLPFIEVDCDKVWQFIQGTLVTQAGFSDRMFGKALARVLGHEIYHAIAGTGKHGRLGVTKSNVSPVDLTRGVLAIDTGSAERMLRQLSGVRYSAQDIATAGCGF